MKKIFKLKEDTTMTWGEYCNSIKQFPSNQAEVLFKVFGETKDSLFNYSVSGARVRLEKENVLVNGQYISPEKTDSVIVLEDEFDGLRIFNHQKYQLVLKWSE